MRARDFVPPILWGALRAAIRRSPPVVEGVGYDTDLVASVVFQKTVALRDALANAAPSLEPNLLRSLPLLALLRSGTRRVLDFGGACGAHYFVARHFADGQLQWTVVDTPAMVRHARQLQNGELTFVDAIPIGDFDAVFTSGTLQYLSDPIATLRELLTIGAPIFYMTRVGLSEGSRMVGMQQARLLDNGPNVGHRIDIPDRAVAFPITMAPCSAFEAGIAEAGYEIICHLKEEAAAYEIDGHHFDMHGYIARRK